MNRNQKEKYLYIYFEKFIPLLNKTDATALCKKNKRSWLVDGEKFVI